MANSLPKDVAAQVKKAVFKKADEYCYAKRGRVENGRFIDELMDDPEIGGVIKEYRKAGRVRTYIKDGVLNTYTKQMTRLILRAANPIQIICRTYNEEQVFVLSRDDIVVCLSSNERIYVIGRGTVLKWETALRKALEYIARTPGVRTDGRYPAICLQLAVINDDITEGDKRQITNALAAVGVKVFFCSA
ncbi:MAG: hypothetical protein HPY53_00795 [Brevinematales bacterium]|nr:hypothetical protein [Brevinematales bacterium]